MKWTRWSLDRVWIWWSTGLILLLFVPSAMFLTYTITQSVERHLVDKGHFFAQAITTGLVEPLLVENRMRMHEILHDAVIDEPRVHYACIVDAQSRILAHSFEGGYPPALVQLWQQHHDSVIRFSAETVKLLDVSVPLIASHQAGLHVGVLRNVAVESSRRALFVLSLTSTVALILVLTGARLIGVFVTRPLEQLETAISRYPHTKEDIQHPQPHGTREVVTLAQGFRDLVERMDHLEQERTTTQESLIHTERLSAVGELAAGLAHEIRNPLDGMMECVRLLEKDTLKSDMAQKYYPMLRDGLERISKTMQSMLVLARSGQPTEVSPCHIRHIVEELEMLVAPLIQDKHIEFIWNKTGPCVCICERHGLLQAGLNLILNAIESVTDHTEQGKVSVHTECDQHWINLSIEDNGPGVPAGMHQRIFDPFISSKPVGKGTGLGLSVSRQLIRAGGGDLQLDPSPSSLGGARFFIRIEKLADENKALRKRLNHPPAEQRIIGRSEAMRQIMARIHAVANTDATILIEGESGTGKELIAREIHLTSPRCGGPFVAVSCAALPRDLMESELFGYEPGAFTGAISTRQGRFELANGGTLFLDDIDDIPLEVQVKLVRILQERVVERIGGQNPIPVDVRILASTKKPLAALVATEQFREDLYYRLNVVPLPLPPLRERIDDIPLLAEYFLNKFAVKMNRNHIEILPEALECLQSCPWPGNVRELEHTMERITALTLQDIIGLADVEKLLPDRSPTSPSVHLSLDSMKSVNMPDIVDGIERQLLEWALAKVDGNLAQAAQILSIPRSTLQYKIRKLIENQDD